MLDRTCNAGPAGDEPFVAGKVEEMAAYDRLSLTLRRALDQAVGQFSAVQAEQWLVEGHTDLEIAILIRDHGRALEAARLAECPPRKPK